MLSNRERVRHLQWDACYNARDLGGYPTESGAETRWGAVVRSDNLSRLSDQGRDALLDYGVSTIVDLRSSWEVGMDPPAFDASSAEESDIAYLHLSLIDESNGDALAVFERAATKEEMYCLMLDVYQQPVAAILNAIAEASDGTVLVHCHSGKDRTGLIAALLLALAGVPRDAIARDYALTDACLQPLHNQLIEENATGPDERRAMADELSSPPEVMHAVFDHLNARYGGVRAYLLSTGLQPATLDRLQGRLVG